MKRGIALATSQDEVAQKMDIIFLADTEAFRRKPERFL
jgi:hypothetical protein